MVEVFVWSWNDSIWFSKTDNPQQFNVFKYVYAHALIIIFLLFCYLIVFWSISLSMLMAEFSVWSWHDRMRLWIQITPNNVTFHICLRACANNNCPSLLLLIIILVHILINCDGRGFGLVLKWQYAVHKYKQPLNKFQIYFKKLPTRMCQAGLGSFGQPKFITCCLVVLACFDFLWRAGQDEY